MCISYPHMQLCQSRVCVKIIDQEGVSELGYDFDFILKSTSYLPRLGFFSHRHLLAQMTIQFLRATYLNVWVFHWCCCCRCGCGCCPSRGCVLKATIHPPTDPLLMSLESPPMTDRTTITTSMSSSSKLSCLLAEIGVMVSVTVMVMRWW